MKKQLNSKNLLYWGGTVLIVTGTMMYVFSTADVVPDAITFFGFLDDASLVILAWLFYRRLKKNLKGRNKK
jgi:uncharacterized membrane protein YkvA (DUF1232 family)